jgi:hypothetical protein
MNQTARLLLAALLVVTGVALRLVPHPWNLTPIGAVALFSGAAFDRKRWAFLTPLAAMLIGDAVVGFHALMPAVYASFAAIVALGLILRDRRDSPLAVGAGAITGSTLFFLTTNFAVWAQLTTYPKTLAGLAQCYAAGLPYYGNMLAADLIYSALLFGTFVWMERRVPLFARR